MALALALVLALARTLTLSLTLLPAAGDLAPTRALVLLGVEPRSADFAFVADFLDGFFAAFFAAEFLPAAFLAFFTVGLAFFVRFFAGDGLAEARRDLPAFFAVFFLAVFFSIFFLAFATTNSF